jgi:hypothetical protein
MIDLILFVFVLGVFFVGFWCGKKFSTVKAMLNAAIDSVSEWFSSGT